MRVKAGELAVSMTRICRETGLAAAAVVDALKVGKAMGLLDVRQTPWAIRI